MKIRIHWGVGLVIGMSLFIGFILFLVYHMLTNPKFDHDLVTEEYYKKELVYQQEIDAETRARKLPLNLKENRSTNGWTIEFPENLRPESISGNLVMYRPSNAKLDFEIPLKLENHRLEIPKEKLVAGRWNIYVHWNYEGESYLFKKEIRY